MKVSKVNHMKEAIINNRGNIEGTLYNSLQGKKTQKADIEVHVRKLAESGQRLYNVLNQKSGYLEQLEKQGNRALARTAKDVISNLNKAFKSIIKKTSSTLGEWRKREIDTFEANLVLEKDEWICKCKKDDKKKKIDWKNADKKEFVHQIILYHLRKSLQKNIKIDEKEKYVKISEVVEQLAYALCCEEGKRVWTGISEDEMKILVAVLKEDYLKTEQIRQIAKSIQNQNVRVQVSKQGNKKLLQLSSADNEKKKHLFEFMKCYAAGGWNERRELLLKIRKLILFYVAGIEEFDEILPLWSWGAYAEEILLEHPWFSVQAAGLTEKRDDLDCKEKTAKREINNQIREELRRENMKRYKRCIESEELSVETAAKCKYWAGFVSKTLENLILNETMVKEYKLSALYLCDKVWENFLSYIAMKYVNMGKAVYHFAFPDFTKAQEDIVIGEILPQFFEGITSFDYERITAEEDLERELSSYVLFGVNNFSRTIASAEEYEKSDKFSDVLQINKKNMVIDSEKADHGKLVLYPDVYRRILQFFGGQSQWQDTELGDDSIALVDAMKEKLAFVRNSSFHYASKHDMEKVCENELVQKIFSKEYADLGKSYRKKYYSNNVPRFYSLEDIDEVMDILYNKAKPRVAQVPAFNNIIKKKDSADVMGRIVAKECVRKMHGRFDSKEVSEMFQSTFLFLLKEIYYYQFLQLPNLMFRFEKAIEKMQKSGKVFR